MEVQPINPQAVRLDGRNVRMIINEEAIQEYENLWLTSPEVFPAIVVFWDKKHFWIADGNHRTLAAKRAKIDVIPAEIHNGSERDAFMYAWKCNTDHGVRRTVQDKRHVVAQILQDEQWQKESLRWIAEHCDVSHSFVATIKGQLNAPEPSYQHDPETGVTVVSGGSKQHRNASSAVDSDLIFPKHSESQFDEENPCPHCKWPYWKPDAEGYQCDRCGRPWKDPHAVPYKPKITLPIPPEDRDKARTNTIIQSALNSRNLLEDRLTQLGILQRYRGPLRQIETELKKLAKNPQIKAKPPQ